MTRKNPDSCVRRTEPRLRVCLLAWSDERLLVVRHSKDGRSYYLLPGGGVQWGETLEEALRREIAEEIGFALGGVDLVAACESVAPDSSRHVVHLLMRADSLETDPAACSTAAGSDPRVAGWEWMERGRFEECVFHPGIKHYLLECWNHPRLRPRLDGCGKVAGGTGPRDEAVPLILPRYWRASWKE